jgi:hypothetical protein
MVSLIQWCLQPSSLIRSVTSGHPDIQTDSTNKTWGICIPEGKEILATMLIFAFKVELPSDNTIDEPLHERLKHQEGDESQRFVQSVQGDSATGG